VNRLRALLGRLAVLAAAHPGTVLFAVMAAGAIDQGLANTQTGVDFLVFQRAAQRFLAGEPLYQAADGHLSFKYLPPAALLFAPFAPLPGRLGWILWNVVTAAAVARSMALAARLSQGPGPLRPHHALLLHGAAIWFVMPFYTRQFFFGQCDGVLLWMVLESERLAARRPRLSGALLAIAACFKPPYALVGGVALLRGQRARVVAAAAAGAAFLLAPALRYGLAGDLTLLATWRAHLARSSPPLLCIPDNVSAWGLACLYLARPEEGFRYLGGLAVVGAACAALVAASAREILRRDARLGWHAALAGVLWLVAFLSPLGWRANLVVLVPLVYLALRLLGRDVEDKVRGAAAVVLLAVAVVTNLHALLPAAVRQWLHGHGDYGFAGAAVAAAALVGTALRVARHAPAAAPGEAPPRLAG
jgi:hypothetical protein